MCCYIVCDIPFTKLVCTASVCDDKQDFKSIGLKQMTPNIGCYSKEANNLCFN